MLSDPISITFDGNAVSLPRAIGAQRAGIKRIISASQYSVANGEFTMIIQHSELGDGMRRAEVLLERTVQDGDSNPFTGDWKRLPNRFGVVFETNNLFYNTDIDIPDLRAALLAFLTDPISDRIMGGEG